MPETYDDMILCNGCEEWYHLTCVKLSKAPKDKLFCDNCNIIVVEFDYSSIRAGWFAIRPGVFRNFKTGWPDLARFKSGWPTFNWATGFKTGLVSTCKWSLTYIKLTTQIQPS